MIPLEKSEEPQVLRENAEEWTRELLERYDEEESFPSSWARARYGRPEIKEQVVSEAHEKCIYCESKVPQVYPGDIEHIRPKSRFPELAFDWDNIAFACQECNRRKGNEWPERTVPLNPFEDDPSQYLHAVGPLVKSRPGAARGEVTIALVELNRTELLERRGERIGQLHTLASRIADVDNEDIRDLLIDHLDELTTDSASYAFIARAYAQVIREDLE